MTIYQNIVQNLRNTLTKIVGIEDNHAPKDELLRVEWNLGKRCNYNCSYCGNELHDNTSDHMPWEVFTNTVDEIRRGSDKKIKLAFTGGEPFVNPKFVDMLKYAKVFKNTKNFHIFVLNNCQKFCLKNCEKLQKVR